MIVPAIAALLATAPLRVFLDAGHGEQRNSGTQLVTCEWEEDVTLAIARAMGHALEGAGYRTRLSRETTPGAAYPQRRDDAEAWGADVFLSVHVDARLPRAQKLDPAVPRAPPPPGGCVTQTDYPGFGILYSDFGDARTVAARRTLARSVARALREARFAPSDQPDEDIVGYVRDREPGILIERRVLFVLRRPKMPSIIIETFNGLNPKEAAAWRKPETVHAFSAAVAAGLRAYAGTTKRTTRRPTVVDQAPCPTATPSSKPCTPTSSRPAPPSASASTSRR